MGQTCGPWVNNFFSLLTGVLSTSMLDIPSSTSYYTHSIVLTRGFLLDPKPYVDRMRWCLFHVFPMLQVLSSSVTLAPLEACSWRECPRVRAFSVGVGVQTLFRGCLKGPEIPLVTGGFSRYEYILPTELAKPLETCQLLSTFLVASRCSLRCLVCQSQQFEHFVSR